VTEGALAGMPRAAKLLKEVVAPTTLATGLLFYFGWSHAYWFFDYFGVNSTLLGLSNRDYLMRGLDGLFVPLVVLAGATLVAVWGGRLLQARLERLERYGRRSWWPPVLGGTGLVLCANGLSRIVVGTTFNRPLALAPLSLATGVAMIAGAVHLRTAGQLRSDVVGLVEYVAVFVLIGLSLFWAANDYAAAVGRSRAAQFARELPSYPEAIVYSEHDLNLTGIEMVSCADTDAAFRFRYDGLALVMHSDDNYVLLPKWWSRQEGVAVVLPRNDSVRLEFMRAGAADLGPTC
jgi:hypothetical protein